jgi:hypothetical protein
MLSKERVNASIPLRHVSTHVKTRAPTLGRALGLELGLSATLRRVHNDLVTAILGR